MKTSTQCVGKFRTGLLVLAAFTLVAFIGQAQSTPGLGWEALAEGGAEVELAPDPAADVTASGEAHAWRLTVSHPGKRYGIVCNHPGLAEIQPGQWYDLSFNARTDTRKTFALTVSLESPDGKIICARTTLPEVGRTDWEHYTVALHIRQPAATSRVVIALADTGSLWLSDLAVVLRKTAESP